MPLVDRAQAGFKAETTYGTPVTVDRFEEFVSEKIKPMYGRAVSSGLRSGQRARRSDRQVPYIKGAGGPTVREVLSKGFGFWLQYMLGTVGSVGPTDAKYVHTGTVGTMSPNESFTYQSNHPLHPADTDQPFTYEGGKIAKWKLSNSVGGLLLAEFEFDFENVATATGLASASYPTAGEPLSFVGGVITIAGSSVDVLNAEVTCDNKLFGLSGTDERRYLRGNAQHKEPVEGDLRDIGFVLSADFDALTQYNRFASVTAAGAVAQIILTWTGAILIGASSFPTLVVTIPAASFDDFDSTIDGPKPLTQKLTGVGLYDGTNSPISVAYGTADATP